MRRIDLVRETLNKMYKENNKGVTAEQIADKLNLQRSNVSFDLNQLVKQGLAKKLSGRPVLFQPAVSASVKEINDTFSVLVGYSGSLSTVVQQGKAAIIYPPSGLHTLIFGETGVGKTMFAELMFEYGKYTGRFTSDAPFVIFNCADYANNPQLLMGQIFGIKKGAYTGAEYDQPGLLEKANGGVMFLDEVHRLTAEGQEMLFTFIDKGIFKRLGETEYTRKANVLIIAATTEDPKSKLLDTFTRRIPMMITIPPLRDRKLSERYTLIEEFFRQESGRIGKDIIVSQNALKSLLLYDCPNNIGQLKSDIQLSCARAFLDCISKEHGKMVIRSKILPEHVKKGILKLKDYREEINQILGISNMEFIFSSEQEIKNIQSSDQYSIPDNFYEMIEKRIEMLRKEGIEDEEINEIIGMDIESYFIKFMGNITKKVNEEEIERIIGKEILSLAKEIIDFAKDKLKHPYLDPVLYGFALHISSTVERLRQKKAIINPQLNDIRKKYPKEFTFAIEIASIIEEKLKIELPIDEIGFLTMFFINREFTEQQEKNATVGILVLMHGDSGAASMAKVANTLLATDLAHGIDMPLNVKPEDIYKEVKELIVKLDQGKGVLILADMGSLINFGDLLLKEVNVSTKTIEMVSTPMVIEATRKAMLGADLDTVYNSAIDINPYLGKKITQSPVIPINKNVIVTGCYTGEGSSVKIKSYISKNIEHNNIDIIPMSFTSISDFKKQINLLSKFKNIIAVVSFVNPDIPSIPFIKLEDIFTEHGQKKLQELIQQEKIFSQIGETLSANLKLDNIEDLVFDLKEVLFNISKDLGKSFSNDIIIGSILHIACLIERLINNWSIEVNYNKTNNGCSYNSFNSLNIIKKHLGKIEKKYNISFPEQEINIITSILLEK